MATSTISLHVTSRPEYMVWALMRKRCNNPNDPAFPSYGGRGIRVCERWSKFDAFIQDLGPRPTSKHTLERIDNNKSYEPSNCRWATRQEQSWNLRTNHHITAFGETKCVGEWCFRYKIIRQVLLYRIYKMKMTPEAALTTPRCRWCMYGRCKKHTKAA